MTRMIGLSGDSVLHRGVLRISSDGDDRMGAKIKPEKSLVQKLTPPLQKIEEKRPFVF